MLGEWGWMDFQLGLEAEPHLPRLKLSTMHCETLLLCALVSPMWAVGRTWEWSRNVWALVPVCKDHHSFSHLLQQPCLPLRHTVGDRRHGAISSHTQPRVG